MRSKAVSKVWCGYGEGITEERRKTCQEEIEQGHWDLAQGQAGEEAFVPDSVRLAFPMEDAGADSGKVSASGAYGEHR
jgi:hypothetical protein